MISLFFPFICSLVFLFQLQRQILSSKICTDAFLLFSLSVYLLTWMFRMNRAICTDERAKTEIE